jgi:hypothetical protein
MAGTITFDIAMLAGAGAISAWILARSPAGRPRTLNRVCAHFVLSFGVFHLVPPSALFLARTLPHAAATVLDVAVVTLPALVYVCLSWLWVLAYLRDALPGRPGGGRLVDLQQRR